jgi:transposase
MLRLEEYVEIQVLKRQGKSMRAISAKLGVSRNTVRKYLRSAKRPKAKERPERPRWCNFLIAFRASGRSRFCTA